MCTHLTLQSSVHGALNFSARCEWHNKGSRWGFYNGFNDGGPELAHLHKHKGALIHSKLSIKNKSLLLNENLQQIAAGATHTEMFVTCSQPQQPPLWRLFNWSWFCWHATSLLRSATMKGPLGSDLDPAGLHSRCITHPWDVWHEFWWVSFPVSQEEEQSEQLCTVTQ